MTADRQTVQNDTTLPAANEGAEGDKTPGASGVAALDRAFSILFAFRPGDYALTLAELAARTGLYKSTILRLAGSLIQHRMLFRLEDGRYQIGAAPLMLGALYQRSMRLGDVVLPHMRALAEATGDVLPLERGSGGRVLCAFSGMQGATYDAIRRDHYYVSIGERDRETVGLSVPVFGAQQALRGALCLAGPASRIDGARLQSWRGPVLEHAAQITSTLGGDPAPLRHAAQLIQKT
jgi:DNA-binding IclR family transcriptional regulator